MERFSIFSGDPFNRLVGDRLDRLLRRWGLGHSVVARVALRGLVLIGITWVPMLIAARLEGNLLGATRRESFLLDLATLAQFLGFVPLAVIAEVFIDYKMREAIPHLERIAEPSDLGRLSEWAARTSRRWIGDFLAVSLGFCFTWVWAFDELGNGLASWHSQVKTVELATVSSPPMDFVVAEGFTAAGAWAAFVALPIFTYLWLRWVWKIGVWTGFLYRVSRLDLRLAAAHPDRTGGLGCLSEVQTSFSVILFGTGILFSVATLYKITAEGTPLASHTVWLPIVGYVFLAPGVFLAPLFLFSKTLLQTRTESLRKFGAVAVQLARRFEESWVATAVEAPGELMEPEPPTLFADFKTAYETVKKMRIVPFDTRSIAELFGSSAAPFAPLAFVAQLPEKVKAALELLGG